MSLWAAFLRLGCAWDTMACFINKEIGEGEGKRVQYATTFAYSLSS